ncbi:hypothetical protein BANT918_02138 [Brevibacterium antiquum CNRZ 918]|uniref:Uncharacterized protein n=1 Tax=Brevibacterium antiquum CNRZ 918 TaxID=1255637 RepID=A0A2H1K4N7_9MICO|nr:hypothetical protein BANT918_02138 [Brevibacterium antiquum CNRZ 918]
MGVIGKDNCRTNKHATLNKRGFINQAIVLNLYTVRNLYAGPNIYVPSNCAVFADNRAFADLTQVPDNGASQQPGSFIDHRVIRYPRRTLSHIVFHLFPIIIVRN